MFREKILEGVLSNSLMYFFLYLIVMIEIVVMLLI